MIDESTAATVRPEYKGETVYDDYTDTFVIKHSKWPGSKIKHLINYKH